MSGTVESSMGGEPTIYRELRPWGSFEVFYEEQGLKIKRITVHPGKRLSLQSHEHRSEIWVVIQGQAVVTRDDRDIPVAVNGSIFLPRQAKHRISNTGTDDVVFIEVQQGTYLGEDDITRYEDDYNRS